MGEEREQRLFPDREQSDQRITCHDITSEFLIYGTDVSDWFRDIALNRDVLIRLGSCHLPRQFFTS